MAKSLFYDDEFAIFSESADSATKVSNNDEPIDIRSSVFVDAADELRNTSLHYCSIFDIVELTTFLIEKGAKTSLVNNNWNTPITILARNQPGTTSTIYKKVYEPL